MTGTVLSNFDRRVIANLSIPRNTLDLETTIRADQYAHACDKDLGAVLANAVKQGWVVELGSRHESPAKLASLVDKHKQARSMPDEKARIYSARLDLPHRAWRAQGEQYVMTDEGFAILHEPVLEDEPLPLSDVQRLLNTEFQRVHYAKVTAGTTLGGKLLEEEYRAWAIAVADAHEEATGERPRLPISGGAGYSDATETLIIDPENGKGSAYTETAPWFMAAVTVAVTDADTGSTITEATYTGYARKSVAAADMGSAASPGGSATNANAITFAAATAGTSAVIGFAKCVASTVGRLIKYGTCATVNVSSVQQPLNFAVGALTTSLD